MSLCHYENLWFSHFCNASCSPGLVLPYHLKKIQEAGEDLVEVHKDGQRYRISCI